MAHYCPAIYFYAPARNIWCPAYHVNCYSSSSDELRAWTYYPMAMRQCIAVALCLQLRAQKSLLSIEGIVVWVFRPWLFNLHINFYNLYYRPLVKSLAPEITLQIHEIIGRSKNAKWKIQEYQRRFGYLVQPFARITVNCHVKARHKEVLVNRGI